MKIPASKVPAQVWADRARRRADLDEVESMLLSSWDDSKQVYRIGKELWDELRIDEADEVPVDALLRLPKQVYRIGKELWDELRIDEADEVPVDALLRLPYGCIFIERRWVDEYEQLLTDDMADTWGEASCYVTRYYEGCFCWVEGRTLFVDSLTHHCEMRHTDDYGSDVAEVREASCYVTRYYEGCFCWVEGRTLFVDSLTHHCEMRHTDDYGSDVAEVRRGMRMWIDTIELPIDEGTSLERWYSEELNVVRKANESMSYACEITDEELLMTAHSHSYLLEHILGSLLYISSKEADVRTVYVPQKNQSRKSRQTDCTVHDVGFRILLEHILGSLLYISSKEADVRTVYVPQKNQSRKSRQTDCTVHDVGFRIAPQLAEVRRVYELEAKGQDGGKTGRHVAPHVRRGHWHGYWTGPRENPTGLEIKWVAPTVVNASRGELGGTVHEVGDRDGDFMLK